MWNYLICSLKTSKIFENYLVYTYQLFHTWISNLDLTIATFISHSFISLRFVYVQYLLNWEYSIFKVFSETIIILLAWILLDLVLYFLWKYLWKYLKFKCESKKIFYIFLRFVPIVWIFWAFIWALLSKDFNYKKDFLKIFIWNILFVIFNITFWLVFSYLCWLYIE